MAHSSSSSVLLLITQLDEMPSPVEALPWQGHRDCPSEPFAPGGGNSQKPQLEFDLFHTNIISPARQVGHDRCSSSPSVQTFEGENKLLIKKKVLLPVRLRLRGVRVPEITGSNISTPELSIIRDGKRIIGNKGHHSLSWCIPAQS